MNMRRHSSKQAPASRSEAALLQRGGGRAAPPMQAPRFAHDFSSVPVRAKLKAGAANDAFEREADRVAETIDRVPLGRLHPLRPSTSKAAPAGVIPVGDGEPLAPLVRTFFEDRLGHDFGHVRVFADARSAELARAEHARAYTVGSSIVFGPGEFAPHTAQGRQILAHELTHVAQQRGTAPTIQRFEAPLHQRAELYSLITSESGGLAGFTLDEAQATYFGNWMRDMNQIFVPMVTKALGNDLVFAAMNYLAMKKFGRTMTPEQFGYYIPAEHIDNPAGLIEEDLLPGQPVVAPQEPVEATAPLASRRAAVAPPKPNASSTSSAREDAKKDAKVKVGGADLFAADESGVMAYIRRSNAHVERRLKLAAYLGRNPEGLMNFGAALHAVEDLFAHSNWIEIATDQVLRDKPQLVPQLTKADRRVFTYAASVNIREKGTRPVLTTGSFTGKDTQMSVGNELVNLLRRPLKPPRSDAETTAEERFTYEVLKALRKRLKEDAGFRAGIEQGVRKSLPNTLGSDRILELPIEQIYSWTLMLPTVPRWVKDVVGITAIQKAVISVISSRVLKPAADQIEASFIGAQVSETSLIQGLDDQKRLAEQHFTPAEKKTMQTVAKSGGASVAAQKKTGAAEVNTRLAALQSTPAQVLAGPSHTQIAKDHVSSPFFGLSFLMATIADRKLRDLLIDAWNEVKPGSGSKVHAFLSRPAEKDAAALYDERQKDIAEQTIRGAVTAKSGYVLPASAYDIAAMRSESAAHVRAVAEALLGIVGSPGNVAKQIDQLTKALGQFDFSTVAAIAKTLGRVQQTAVAAQAWTDRNTGLKKLAAQLEVDAALIEAAGRSPTLEERAATNKMLVADRSKAADLLSRSPGIDSALAALILFALSAEVSTTAPAYEPRQRDVLEGKSQLAGVATQTIDVQPLAMQSIEQLPPKIRALLAKSREIITHPYEGAWWVPTVTKFIQDHPAQIAAEVEARNRGYAFIRQGTTGHVESE